MVEIKNIRKMNDLPMGLIADHTMLKTVNYGQDLPKINASYLVLSSSREI